MPRGAETCGAIITETMVLVGVQHPGESDDASLAQPVSHWRDGGTAVARPAVAAIFRDNGGPIGA